MEPALDSRSELNERLDSLWVVYLKHLDAYTSAQQLLQKQLSTGFFALARANFTSRDGRRYGKDYYHDGAIATKRTKIDKDKTGGVSIEIVNWNGFPRMNTPSENESEPLRSQDTTSTTGEQRSDINSETPIAVSTRSLQEESKTLESTEKLPLEADALRWFGLLSSRELRDTQSCFSAAFDGLVSDVVNASRGMREVEIMIRKLRKEVRKADKESR